MAYILGFTTADGNIYARTLSIELQDRDVAILEFIKNQISPTAPIKPTVKKGRKYKRLRLNSTKLVNHLAEFGIIPNKSATVCIDFIIPPRFLGDYIRGVFDGDGSVRTRRNSIESEIYSASFQFLKQLKELLGNRGYITRKTRCYALCFSKNPSLWLAQLMYQDSKNFALERKKRIFLNYKYEPSPRYWTEDQVNLLITEFPKMGAKPLVEKLSRSYKAIHKKVWELKKKCILP